MEILDLKTNLLNQNNYTYNQLTSAFVGSLVTYPINYIPPKCLPCDGYILKIADYKELYSVIKDNFNNGTEAADEFRIPDYNISKRFLQPTTNAGIKIEAGLPNITGTFGVCGVGYTPTGAFQYLKKGSALSNSGEADNIYDFNASRSSSIYGKSSTVQPPSQGVHVCIRYK